jgi:hypothetical protein
MNQESLRRENEKLKSLLGETLWMARRYADGRSTYAPSIVNESIDFAVSLGVRIDPDDGKMYASDGDFGNWNPETKRFSKEGTQAK